MRKVFIFFVLLFILMLLNRGFASFCCNDQYGQAKCWINGTCCQDTWYIGCSCSDHPTHSSDCVASSSLHCDYNGDVDDVICCPVQYWNPFQAIDNYYCYCSDYDTCGWLFTPNIMNPQPNETVIDYDSDVIFTASITPDKSMDASNNISFARVCWYDDCSSVACVMSSSGDQYSCSVSASSIGTGDKYFYVWSNDTHGAYRVLGPVHFVIRNIYINSIYVSGDTTDLVVGSTNVTYDNGMTVNGNATCWLSSYPSSECLTTVTDGKFECSIHNSKLESGANEIKCKVTDSNNVVGINSTLFDLTGSITDFKLVKPSSGITGPDGEIRVNITVGNTGDIDWKNNLFVRVNTTSGPIIGKFCEVPVDLSKASSKEVSCNSTLSQPGKYSLTSYVIYKRSDGREYILAQRGGVNVQVINITIYLDFVGLEHGWASPCEAGYDCDANYTRGQPVIFRVIAKYWPNPYYYHECSSSFGEDYCEVSYLDPNTNTWSSVEGFGNEWIDQINTSGLACDSIHNLTVKVIRSGVETVKTKRFYISCVPKITAVPSIVRMSVGNYTGEVFNVTIWNPTDNSLTFDLSTTTRPEWFSNWLILIPHDSTGPLKRTGITIPSIGSDTSKVNLTQSGEAGNYEVTFKGVDENGREYKVTTHIFIYAEGLSEFGFVGVVAIVFVSSLIFYRLRVRK